MKPSQFRQWRKARGFTLVEMLTVLAIIVLLSGLSAVAVNQMSSRNRIRFAGRQLQAALLQARQHAIATNSKASLVVYSGERLAVVTDSQYRPLDTPVVLPEGILFRPAAKHVVNATQWTQTVGDTKAVTTAGYRSNCRPMLILTFRHDGTVHFVTPNANSAKRDGPVVICVGGSAVGVLKGGTGRDDNIIQVTGYGAFESRGIAVLENEIISYQSIAYEPVGNRYVLKDVGRGVYSARRSHPDGAQVFSGSNSAIYVVFPLTGGIVRASR